MTNLLLAAAARGGKRTVWFLFALLSVVVCSSSLVSAQTNTTTDEDDGGVNTFGSLFEGFGSLFVAFGTQLYGGKCGPSPDGCLLGVLAYNMYQGVPGTTTCTQICTLYPSVKTNFTCGTCNDIIELPSDLPSLVPSSAPSAIPETTNSTLPSDMPSLSPVQGNGGNEATVLPSDFPSLSPAASVAPSGLLAITKSPVSEATSGATIRVRIDDFYIAYVAPQADREPTAAEYAEMLNRTNTFYQNYLTTFYASNPDVTFLRIDLTSDDTRYQAGIPEERFNIYINFALTELQFSTDDSTTPQQQPNATALFQIMRDALSGSNGVDYIIQFVQTLAGSPFESTEEIFFSPTTTAAPTTAPVVDVTPRSDYDIQLQYVNVPDDDVSLFVDAANRWSEIVIGDLGSRVLSQAPDAPPAGCSYPNLVDDLYICMIVQEIDGNGTIPTGETDLVNVFATAQPTWIRGANGLPVAGFVQFDRNDWSELRQNGALPDIVVHEMAHVLGYGNLWTGLDGITTPVTTTPAGSNCAYTGTLAVAEYNSLAGCGTTTTAGTTVSTIVPLEESLVEGSACVHWSEDCFDAELMTPRINIGSVQKISRLTIASLADIGYNVSYETADDYTAADLSNIGGSCTCGAAGRRRLKGRSGSRSLSAAAHQGAIDYGQSILQANRLSDADLASSRLDDADLVYVGDKVIAVLVLENGAVYNVVVTAE